ncbi:tetratricopeptide repeat protein [Nitratireductor sp. GCM10026969]|uniref:tetratricopeptide repeat protein n=1 Tax=Nitratireductor sp. GCM10026969 TaxID=3252645 RepID=UPI00361BD0A7
MHRTVLIAGALLSLAGCQTVSVNEALDVAGAPTSSGDISEGDLRTAKAHFREGNYGLAEKHFRKAVELRASNAEAWLGLAATYDNLGRFEFADRAYAQLLKLVGRKPRVINNMGYSYLLRGNRKQARELLTEANAALPGDPRIAANLALLNKN